jgi:hypothetical protein
MTEYVSPSSAYTIAWFPSKGLAISENNPPEPSTQGWIIFFWLNDSSTITNTPICYLSNTIAMLFDCRFKIKFDHFSVFRCPIKATVCSTRAVEVSQ